MDRAELHEYLAFYRDALRRDPENVEARLRLAGIFRQLDEQSLAIDEYQTASQLLANRGLPLEAIAACKAILELDPEHTDTQMFLARLYARNPDAGDSSMRIAKPLERMSGSRSARQRDELEQLDELREARQQELEPRPESPAPTVVTSHPAGPGRTGADVDETTEVDAEVPAEIRETDQWKKNESDEYANPPQSTQDSIGREGERRLRLKGGDLNRVSRREMDHLLSTTDIEPEDIVSDERSAVGSLPGGEPTFDVDVFDLDSIDLTDELPPEWRDIELEARPDSLIPTQGGASASPSAPGRQSTPPVSTVAVEPESLPEIPLFGQVDPGIFVELLSAIDVVEPSRDTNVIEYGDDNRHLYVIVDGELLATRVNTDGERVTLCRLGPGEFFGEFGMLTRKRSGATVTTVSDAKLLAFPRSLIIRICLAYPDIWESLWDFYHVRRLDNMLKLHPVFRRMPPEAREKMRESFQIRECRQGTSVLTPGEAAERVRAVSVGELAIRAAEEDGIVARRHPGEVVGLVSGVRQRPVRHSVVATTDTALLSVDRAVCKSVVESHPQVDRLVEAQPFPADLTAPVGG